MRRSILPNSAPHILQPINGKHGVLRVRTVADGHGLYFGDSLIALHNNGFSCRALAERIDAAWEGKGTANRALEQFDYILACGGLDSARDTIARIVRGEV